MCVPEPPVRAGQLGQLRGEVRSRMERGHGEVAPHEPKPVEAGRRTRSSGLEAARGRTDHGTEFRAREFGAAVDRVGARQRSIRAGGRNSNGCIERLQLTILEECWRPVFARSRVPTSSALTQDLDEYFNDYNYECAETGRLTQGSVPADIVYGARKTTPGR
jgi:transposase InsO family protein